MTSRRLRALLVLALAVAAVAVAGGALETGGAGGGAPGAGDSGGVLVGDGDDGVLPDGDSSVTLGGSWLATLVRVTTALLLVATALFLVVALARYDVRTLLGYIAAAAPVVAVLAAVALAMLLATQVVNDLFGVSGSNGGASGGGGVGVGGEDSGVALDLPLPVLLLVGGLAVLVGLLVVWLAGDDGSDGPDNVGAAAPSTVPEQSASSGGTRTRSALGADVPADNEVYRAWLALAAAADATPRDSPGAVERQAVAAGVDESTAGEITALFEAVRYGDAPVTDERARRAAEARSSLDSRAGGRQRPARGEPS